MYLLHNTGMHTERKQCLIESPVNLICGTAIERGQDLGRILISDVVWVVVHIGTVVD